MNKFVELLAPAKDIFKAKIAINYGADAVYIGGKNYSLRSRASNFSNEEIKEIVQYAHNHNAKVYVTCNIEFHDEDFEGFEDYIKLLDSYYVDAVIVSSLGALKICKKVAPDLSVHLSTQASVINSDACNMMNIYGVNRVILGRECSMEDIESIADKSIVPLEVFIHGGMCANCSGRCTLSNRMTNRDANRGGCAHSCRWTYSLYEDGKLKNKSKTIFSMSSKDLCGIEYLKRLIDAGVCSFKIEGRMKSEYYIAQLVKTYKKAIEEILAFGELSNERLLFYQMELRKAENRPYSDGFFPGVCDENYTLYSENGAGVTHSYVALVKGYNSDTKEATIEVKNIFSKGDILEVFGPLIDNKQMFCPVLINEFNEELDTANHPTQILKMAVPFEVHENDMIRVLSHED